MMIDGQLYRVIERAYFDLEARLALMDAEGVDVQVVSPLPELLGYWLDPGTAVELARWVNDDIAEALGAAPDRLEGLGMLPLQDIDTSAGMVADLSTREFRGIEVGSNVNGRSIADPVFDPVLSELAANGLSILVHGLRPAGTDRLLGPKLLTNVIGIPQDCASAISSFIATDVLARHPDLRLGFVHAGGTFGSVLDRMDFVWREFPNFRESSTTSPRAYVKNFFFDTITYSVPYLRYLMDAFGVDTLMCGSDGPAVGAQGQLARFISEACLEDVHAADQMLWRNAARFLGLEKEFESRIT
jgi:aminocarboxymuconate-semialdehyde decarboxylase